MSGLSYSLPLFSVFFEYIIVRVYVSSLVNSNYRMFFTTYFGFVYYPLVYLLTSSIYSLPCASECHCTSGIYKDRRGGTWCFRYCCVLRNSCTSATPFIHDGGCDEIIVKWCLEGYWWWYIKELSRWNFWELILQ